MTELERLAATARRLEAELETAAEDEREGIIRELDEIRVRFDDLMREGLA